MERNKLLEDIKYSIEILIENQKILYKAFMGLFNETLRLARNIDISKFPEKIKEKLEDTYDDEYDEDKPASRDEIDEIGKMVEGGNGTFILKPLLVNNAGINSDIHIH